MLDHALDLVEMGFAVFPVGPDCRVPRTPKREGRTGGVWLASSNPEEVRKMRWEGSNVAVATGSRSGVFVLDIDVKTVDGFASARKLGLPESWKSRTPSGGEHWWFKQPRQALRNRVNFLPGLDIRTTGGSVAAPPSRKPSGPYEWIVAPWAAPLAEAPRAFIDLIDPPQPPLRKVKVRLTDNYVRAAFECEVSSVATAKSGRNQALFVAACRLGRFVQDGRLSGHAVMRALSDAATANGLWKEDGAAQVRATISSGMHRASAPRSDITSSMRAILEQRE